MSKYFRKVLVVAAGDLSEPQQLLFKLKTLLMIRHFNVAEKLTNAKCDQDDQFHFVKICRLQCKRFNRLVVLMKLNLLLSIA